MSRLDCLYVHQERQSSIFCSFVVILIPAHKAKYAYRSIAEFVKHVSTHDDEYLRRNPFPAHDIQNSLVEEKSDRLERGIGITRLQNSEKTGEPTSEPHQFSAEKQDFPQTDADIHQDKVKSRKTFPSEQFSIPGNRSQGIEDENVSPDLMIQLAQNL